MKLMKRKYYVINKLDNNYKLKIVLGLLDHKYFFNM